MTDPQPFNHDTSDEIELSILLPVRNESMNLKIMLRILKAALDTEHEILVIHDTPEDSSIPVVKSMQDKQPNVRLVYNSLGIGVINAIRAGVAASRGRYVLIFAADEVGPVIALEEILELARRGCDFVSCTRYAHGGRRLGGSLIGRFLSRLANRLFHLLAGSVFTDSTTGIKLFRREIFERLNLEARPIGWAVAFEMAIKAQALGLELGEVPIVSIDRLYGGKSTFRLGQWAGEYLRWFVWGITHLRRVKGGVRAKVHVRVPVGTVQ